jgi:hypothetical protein
MADDTKWQSVERRGRKADHARSNVETKQNRKTGTRQWHRHSRPSRSSSPHHTAPRTTHQTHTDLPLVESSCVDNGLGCPTRAARIGAVVRQAIQRIWQAVAAIPVVHPCREASVERARRPAKHTYLETSSRSEKTCMRALLCRAAGGRNKERLESESEEDRKLCCNDHVHKQPCYRGLSAVGIMAAKATRMGSENAWLGPLAELLTGRHGELERRFKSVAHLKSKHQ